MIQLTYPDRAIRVPQGLTVLEASYRRRVPHANVRGGQGRCSTCRIRIVSDRSGLPASSAREAFVLERVGAIRPYGLHVNCDHRKISPSSLCFRRRSARRSCTAKALFIREKSALYREHVR